MKHYSEYYTCDRCGKKIKDVPRHLAHIKKSWNKSLKIETRTVEPFVSGMEDDSMEVIVSYGAREKEYDLCPKCRKDFERFMRNE